MIQPNELRIGNLVYSINRKATIHIPELPAFKIITIDLFKAEILLPELNPANQQEIPKFHYSDLSPIPLTEELLIKCGFAFKRYLSLNKRWHCVHSSKLMGFESYENKDAFYYESQLCDVEIKYMHQLQNIFYSLTGKELEVKL